MKVVRGDAGQVAQDGTFTGQTQLTRVLTPQQPGGMTLSLVRFEDGARTHWHTHPGE
jgi:quercetin dioxygenase-like cupin family protein